MMGTVTSGVHGLSNIKIRVTSFVDGTKTAVGLSGFGGEVDQNYVLLCYYAASNGKLLPTFRDNVSFPSSRVKDFLPLNNNPEESNSQIRNSIIFMDKEGTFFSGSNFGMKERMLYLCDMLCLSLILYISFSQQNLISILYTLNINRSSIIVLHMFIALKSIKIKYPVLN
jgi:hypothetical protein